MSGLEQIGPVEPTHRPTDPAWKWAGGGWKAEICGMGCYLFRSFGSDPDYHACVQLASGAYLTGDLFKGVEEAAKDARLLVRLAQLYEVDRHLSHPLGSGSVAQAMPQDLAAFHPDLRSLIVQMCERVSDGEGDLVIGEVVSASVFAGGKVPMGAHDLAVLVAYVVHVARLRGYQIRQVEEAAAAAAARPGTGCRIKASWPRPAPEGAPGGFQPAAAPGSGAAPARSREELERELEGVRRRIKAAHEVDDEVDRRLKYPENLDEAQRRRYRATYDATASALEELTVSEAVLEWVLGQRRRSPSDVLIPNPEGA